MIRRPVWGGILGATIAVVGGASSAFAIYAFLTTTLSGPAIGGVTPQGTASINQSGLPTKAGTLCLSVTNVNLPDGTVLDVILTDCGPDAVATFRLSGGAGKLNTALPAGCQIGGDSSIYLRDGGTTILSGGARWLAVCCDPCPAGTGKKKK
jgi:hypothetical protein